MAIELWIININMAMWNEKIDENLAQLATAAGIATTAVFLHTESRKELMDLCHHKNLFFCICSVGTNEPSD